MMKKLITTLSHILSGKSKKHNDESTKSRKSTRVVKYSKSDQTLCALLLDTKRGALGEEDAATLLDLINRTEKSSGVPYDAITEFIFNEIDYKNSDEFSFRVKEKLDTILDIESTYHQKFKNKFLRHVKLSIIQKNHIDKQSIEASETAKEAKKVSENAKDMAEQAKTTKSKIYTDFIAILGIFTAITFATFGGLQLLGNVFGNIKEVTHTNLGGTLVLGSVFIMGTYLLLIALFSGISRISDVSEDYKPSGAVASLVTGFCLLLIGLGFYLIGIVHF